MPTRFDCEDEPNEHMEMPCKCECGKWFDLHDGHNSSFTNKIICAECKEDEKKFHKGDEVEFVRACYINGRLRAYEYDEAQIVSLSDCNGYVAVKVKGQKKWIKEVPIDILRKI